MSYVLDRFSDHSGPTIESPVNAAHRERLLQKVRVLYQEWTRRNFRYEWHETDDPWDNSGAIHRVDMVGIPSISEWLHEYTGERTPTFTPGSGWEYPTYAEDVWDLVIAIVWGAFEARYGPEWQDHGVLDDAACAAEGMLYRWLEK